VNLGQLITEAQRIGGRVDSDFSTRTRRWLNEAMEIYAMSIPWPTLIQRETVITNGQRNLVLPQRMRVVRWLGDIENKRKIRPNDHMESEFETSFFNPQSSQAFFYRQRGLSPVTSQPTTPTPIVFNTATSDAFSAYISGLVLDTRSSGTANYKVQASEEIILGGTTNYTSVNSYIQIFTVGKNDFTLADLVAYNGSNVISRVESRRYRAEYRFIEFIHTPPANKELEIEYLAAPEALVDNYQIPQPGIDVDYLIHYAAAKQHLAQNRPELAQGLMAEAQAILNRKIYQERSSQENDLRAIPDPLLTSQDDMDGWRQNW
jgi:hypothetical protein